MCWNYEKGMKKAAYPVDMPLRFYRSSRKYANPRCAGGWFSFFMRSDETMSTMIVQMYGSIFRIS